MCKERRKKILPALRKEWGLGKRGRVLEIVLRGAGTLKG